MVTQKRLKELFSYNPETGVFIRLKPRGGEVVGAVAGNVQKNKQGPWYLQIQIDYKDYKMHRLAFLYMMGRWPKNIDHISGDGTDNKWANLREVSKIENARNQKIRCTNTSGIMGVSWHKIKNKWCASIHAEDKLIYLGAFVTLYAATYARHAAELRYGYHPNHGKRY